MGQFMTTEFSAARYKHARLVNLVSPALWWLETVITIMTRFRFYSDSTAGRLQFDNSTAHSTVIRRHTLRPHVALEIRLSAKEIMISPVCLFVTQ